MQNDVVNKFYTIIYKSMWEIVGVGCAKYSNFSSLQITMQMLIGSPFFESNWGKKIISWTWFAHDPV